MTQAAVVVAARTEIVASVPGPVTGFFFTQEKLPTIALHIVITSDTIFGAQFAASNLARGWFVYRLSDDTFRRYRSRAIANDFPYRAIGQTVEGYIRIE